ncbi:7084_t:CDS:2 [Entrophospora sp. SA101]|nr:7084_t:CDS:2 [Entrophospora sp. SA101]
MSQHYNSLWSISNTKDVNILPILTTTAHSIYEGVLLFFMALFISMFSASSLSSSSSNKSFSIERLIFIPQHKTLYNVIKYNKSNHDMPPK